MSESWERRKRAELLGKLRAVGDELDRWLAASERDERLEKHCSQIRRVVGQLRPLAAQVETAIGGPDLQGRWRLLEESVRDLHRVWGFFRDKLAARDLEPARAFLVLADDFAWACYEPAQKAAVAAGRVPRAEVREPPLTYLSTAADPFSVSRREAYGAAVGAAPLSTPGARQVVEQLPVPVVGLPWLQLGHLPDALVIGHEVGHIVLHELIGVGVVEELVAAAVPVERCSQWRSWAEEAFADVYGALCGGPAYAAVLADFLSAPDGANGDDPWYPPPDARLRLVDEVVRGRGGGPETERAVARALVDRPFAAFGGQRLPAVIDYTALQDGKARDQGLLDGWKPTTDDIRTLLAAAAYAFIDDPELYRDKKVADVILATAWRIRQPGTRFQGDGKVDLELIERADERNIANLYRALTGGT